MSEQTQIACAACSAINRIPSNRLNDVPKCGRCKQPLFSGQVIELTQGNFSALVQRSDIPVVVDFWAAWCGPCKMMAPAFAAAVNQLEPQARLLKLNTETEQQIAAQFAIRSIPTIAIFKHGKEIARQAGAVDTTALVNWVRSQLG